MSSRPPENKRKTSEQVGDTDENLKTEYAMTEPNGTIY